LAAEQTGMDSGMDSGIVSGGPWRHPRVAAMMPPAMIPIGIYGADSLRFVGTRQRVANSLAPSRWRCSSSSSPGTISGLRPWPMGCPGDRAERGLAAAGHVGMNESLPAIEKALPGRRSMTSRAWSITTVFAMRPWPSRIGAMPAMRSEAEAMNAQGLSKGDPRVTRLGMLIRGDRIVGLPRAWTRLKGKRGFLGRRSERREIVANLEERLSDHANRHMAKPDLNDWAQVTRPWGTLIEDTRHKRDHEPCSGKSHGPSLDLLIMLGAFRHVSWQEGTR
jgi:hypothetical protein